MYMMVKNKEILSMIRISLFYENYMKCIYLIVFRNYDGFYLYYKS